MAGLRRMNINHLRHVEPLKSTRKVCARRMRDRFGEGLGNELAERADRIYEQFVDQMPYTGAGLNPHAHALYDSIYLFAYWEAMPEDRRETVEEFTKTVSLVFNGDADSGGMPISSALRYIGQHFPQVVKPVVTAVGLVFAPETFMVEHGKWGNAWRMYVNRDLPEGALMRAELVGCPIVDFARDHGYMDLMPAMCNPDFEPFDKLGFLMVRPTTVSMGCPVCDTLLYPDTPQNAQAARLRTDENGILYNEVPPTPAAEPQPVEPKLPLTWAYYNMLAPLVRHQLQRRYGYELARAAYDGARPIYRDLIDACPPVGEGNPMASNLYESCVVFAMYRAAQGAVTPDMFRAALKGVFDLPAARALFGMIDLRKPKWVAFMNRRMRSNADWVDAHPQVADATWDFNFDDTRNDTVVHYHFTHCPINDFAREQGLMDILPVMCEIDYLTAELVHGKLTRNYTLATGGPVCDYLIEPCE